MEFSFDDGQLCSSVVWDSYSYACIFHGAGQACVFVIVKYFFYCFQGFCQPGGLIYYLAVGQFLSWADGVAVADFPWADANLFCQLCQHHFHGEAGLCHAKASEGTGWGVVGVVCFSVYLEVLVVVWAGGVGAGSF